jgi:hypothetical protein
MNFDSDVFRTESATLEFHELVGTESPLALGSRLNVGLPDRTRSWTPSSYLHCFSEWKLTK